MSLESVVSVIAGWILLGQMLGGREIFGCVLMFIAIIIAQLPDRSILNRLQYKMKCDYSESLRKKHKYSAVLRMYVG